MTDRERNDGNHPQSGDPLGTLLEAAGKRPDVPKEREARARAAAHDEWRRLVERRRAARRRRFVPLAVAAGLVVTFLGAWWWNGRTPGEDLDVAASLADASMTVERIRGSATWRALDDASRRTLAIEADTQLRPGVEILTRNDGRASFLTSSGHSLRLDRGTRLVWETGGRWALMQGAIYVSSAASNDRTATLPVFVVDTPFGRVVEVGTQFEVRVDRSVKVRLREGAVRWRPIFDEDVERTVAAGTELVVRGEDDAVERAIAPTDGAWQWMAELSPAIELQDRSVSEVLGVLAREHGVTWEYEDAAMEADGHDILLTGGRLPSGASLDEALDTVLPVSGWTRGETGQPGVVTIGSD